MSIIKHLGTLNNDTFQWLETAFAHPLLVKAVPLPRLQQGLHAVQQPLPTSTSPSGRCVAAITQLGDWRVICTCESPGAQLCLGFPSDQQLLRFLGCLSRLRTRHWEVLEGVLRVKPNSHSESTELLLVSQLTSEMHTLTSKPYVP